MDWLKIGKGVHQGYILSPCLFNFYTEYIMQNASWINGHEFEQTLGVGEGWGCLACCSPLVTKGQT